MGQHQRKRWFVGVKIHIQWLIFSVFDTNRKDWLTKIYILTYKHQTDIIQDKNCI